MFELHSQLQKDCTVVMDLLLCRLLLSNDANYPWFILVPMREGISEIYSLDKKDQLQLLEESNALSLFMANALKPDKLNVAALGNMVPQLHIHHIARYKTDPAWPAPVWGKVTAIPYVNQVKERLLDAARLALKC